MALTVCRVAVTVHRSLSVSLALIRTSSGCGKREAAHKKWFMVTPEKKAPVTGATLRTGPVPADFRKCTPSVRKCVTR